MRTRIAVVCILLCAVDAAAEPTLPFELLFDHPSALLESHNLSIDAIGEIATWTLIFKIVPDFYTTDSEGRAKHSFQYYIFQDHTRDWGYSNQRDTDALIRGTEIQFNDDIRVRDGLGEDGGPNSGGWGPIRGAVPFTLNGKTLTFSTPFLLLNDPDGAFYYHLEFYSFGHVRDRYHGLSVALFVEPEDFVECLIDHVEQINTNGSLATNKVAVLLKKLQKILDRLEAGKDPEAISMLQGFLVQIQGWAGKHLPIDEAQSLIDTAQEALALLEVPVAKSAAGAQVTTWGQVKQLKR